MALAKEASRSSTRVCVSACKSADEMLTRVAPRASVLLCRDSIWLKTRDCTPSAATSDSLPDRAVKAVLTSGVSVPLKSANECELVRLH